MRGWLSRFEQWILIILVAPVAGKLSDTYGSRWLMTIGMVLLGVQLLYLSQLSVDSTFWNLLPGFLVGGLGMAITMTPTAAAATRAVPVEKSGVGSAAASHFCATDSSANPVRIPTPMAKPAQAIKRPWTTFAGIDFITVSFVVPTANRLIA